MTTVILFVLGAIIGSFLNVVSLRWENKNFGGRSYCPHCKKKLTSFELVPILSFFFLLGKCRNCKTKISWQYPLVEICTGIVFATIPMIFLPVFCVYIVIAAYDLRTKIIPDELSYTAMVLSLFVPLFFIEYSLWDWFSGPILFLFFALVWLLSKGRAMGFGDAKLSLSIGILLGFAKGLSSITLAFWVGAAFSVTYLLLLKWNFIKGPQGVTMKSEIPFAPFIIIGALASLFFNLNLLHVPIF